MEGRSIPHLRDIFGLEGVQEEQQRGVVQEAVGTAEEDARSGGGRKASGGGKKADEAGKHLERHLSMKKTIRKKIMRELQQAFVEDPAQLSGGIVEDKAAVNISFGKGGNFLDFLRRGEGEGEPRQETPPQDKQAFWRRFTFKRTKR